MNKPPSPMPCTLATRHWLLAVLTPLLAAALALFALPALASQRIALVIGNGAYQHDKMLPNPRNDADGIAAVLRRLGFQVTQGKDLVKSAMERTVLEFGRKAGGAEIALVYFAGHGLEVGGRNYLLPVDAKLPDELALRTEAVDLELILEAVAPARTRLLFLDACRNNPLANNMRVRTAGRSVGRGLGRVDAVSNTLIAFATAPGTVAADGDGRNSPFAAALMAHLEKPGLEIQQVMREVRRSVAQATGNQQVPWESSQLFEAVVLRPGAAAVVASVVPEPVRPAVPAPTPVHTPAPAPVPPAPAQRKPFEPEMVRIGAGNFMMGSPAGEAARSHREGPQRRVNVKAFELSKTEVTQGQWKAMMGSNPSGFSHCGDNCPVEKVSWNDVQEYIGKLNRKTGQRYRLPSEAEWEFAARSGCDSAFNVGGQCASKIEASQANFDGNVTYNGSAKGVYRKKTTAVGSFKPNSWGLSDMHGNVSEWVQDCFEETYSKGQPSDGSAHGGTDSDCSSRVLRDGSWDHYPEYLRSAYRGKYSPSYRYQDAGFRVARTVP